MADDDTVINRDAPPKAPITASIEMGRVKREALGLDPKASLEEMMIFLSALASGQTPFEAARNAGRPLSYWRGLARKDADFAAALEHAFEDFAHAMAAGALEKADGADVRSKAGVAKAKLQSAVRMGLAKAYAREQFGDKVDVTRKTVDVRRTEFVSYFGVRVMKQAEPPMEVVVKKIEESEARLEAKAQVVEVKSEEAHVQEAEAVGGRVGPGPDDPSDGARDAEGLRQDEPQGQGPGEQGVAEPVPARALSRSLGDAARALGRVTQRAREGE